MDKKVNTVSHSGRINKTSKNRPAEWQIQQGGFYLSFCDYSPESTGQTQIVSTQYQKPLRQTQKPVFMRGCTLSSVIPTRSCQKFSKQICLWDLAQSIGILFIIQIVWAIWIFVAMVLPANMNYKTLQYFRTASILWFLWTAERVRLEDASLYSFNAPS